MIVLEVIRARNEAGKAAIEWCAYGHDESERAARADVDMLIAEVERLRKIVEATNPCPKCHTIHLVRREIF